MSDDKPEAKLAFHEIPLGTDLGSVEYEVREERERSARELALL